VKLAGIILAAGESSRMGTDKALLPFGGATFLGHLVEIFLPRVAPVIVVLGHHAGEIRAAVPARPGVEIALNPDYRRGQLSSLQAGIRALPAASKGALVTLVDHPAVAPATIDVLIQRFQSSGAPLAIPRYEGRRGHPVLFARAILDEIAGLPSSATAKQVVHAHQNETLYVDVADPGVLQDVDTPDDYTSLGMSGARGRRTEG
jgi:molybdenum cofactor cytidylyltransferase